jgi:DNA-binding CsgD family transcriptional regulator
MRHLSQRDVRAVLSVVSEAPASDGPLPFTEEFLDRLRELVRADWVDCGDMRLADCELLASTTVPLNRPMPTRDDTLDLLHRCSYPLLDVAHHADVDVLKLSDLVGSREWRTSPIYALEFRPLGLRDEMKVWLPAPPGIVRVIEFLRARRSFSEHDRSLVRLIRPALALISERFDRRRGAPVRHDCGLTDREGEILDLVASGKTNREIAAALVVSPHTVRKHLEHAYEKLGVHTRTAAVARAFEHGGRGLLGLPASSSLGLS